MMPHRSPFMTPVTSISLIGAAILTAVLAATSLRAEPEIPATPEKSVGVSAETLAEIMLADELQDIGNRRLRMRLITVEKGGIVAEHSHDGRPSVEFILEGTSTEFRDGTGRVVKAGDHVRADHTVTHWWRNDTDGPLTVLAVDIYEPHEEPPY